MPTFTVHEPAPCQAEAASSPERFVFVRDGFHFWAFLLAPFWLLVKRLWLVFVIYVVVSVLLGVGLALLGATSSLQWVVGLMMALLMGFEAASVWRWTLAQRGWKTLGFVVGEDAEMAERRFYAAWAGRKAEPSPPPTSLAPAPSYGLAVRRGPPSPSDVIGLFPEPGA